MFNPMLINPGYVGSHEDPSFTALSRFQWVGHDDAPQTHTLTGHMLFDDKQNAVGGGITFDQLGVSTKSQVYGAYSHIILMEHTRLSLGLSGGLSIYQNNFSQLRVEHETDELFEEDFSVLRPVFGAGAFYYGERYYLGLSTPGLVDNARGSFVQDIHFYATGGYVFPLTEDESYQLKPNFLVKMVRGAPVQMDLNLNLLIKKVFWIGFSYRSLESLDILAEFQANDKLRIGYSYDMISGDVRVLNRTGSHEIMVNYLLKVDKQRKVTRPTSPIYF